MQAYVVCFDISDDGLRRQVSRRLEHFGLRVQRSVFEVSLDSNEALAALNAELLEWLEAGDDLRFYPLCRACRQKARDAQGNRVAAFPAGVVI
jgi:CRISPR-associated protein Cas2